MSLSRGKEHAHDRISEQPGHQVEANHGEPRDALWPSVLSQKNSPFGQCERSRMSRGPAPVRPTASRVAACSDRSDGHRSRLRKASEAALIRRLRFACGLPMEFLRLIRAIVRSPLENEYRGSSFLEMRSTDADKALVRDDAANPTSSNHLHALQHFRHGRRGKDNDRRQPNGAGDVRRRCSAEPLPSPFA
jgi:hypothetical protein